MLYVIAVLLAGILVSLWLVHARLEAVEVRLMEVARNAEGTSVRVEIANAGLRDLFRQGAERYASTPSASSGLSQVEARD